MTEEKQDFEYKHGFRLGPFIFAWAVIYYLVFGILCNYYEKGFMQYTLVENLWVLRVVPEHTDNILFIYQNLWVTPFRFLNPLEGTMDINWGTWYIFIIFLLVAMFVGYKEDFLIYAVKRNLWLIPHVLILSIIWDGINDAAIYRSFVRSGTFLFTIVMNVAEYFTSWHGYVNIAVLIVVFVGGGLLGGWLKIFRRQRLLKKAQLLIAKEVEI